jgi:isopenicillin-N epimerase
VLDVQRAIRDQLEAQPMAFFAGLEARLDAARAAVAGFLGAPAAGLAFVTNATTAVNAVVRSLRFRPGDQLLVTDHGYNACSNAVRFAAERAGAELVVAELPFPTTGPDQLVDRLLAAVTPRTRFALIDHVTSPTALVLPVARIARALAGRGIELMVDGAHAPGMLPLDLAALADAGVGYYAGNLHKWVCAPKGAGFLFVREDRRDRVRPVVISHGANAVRDDRSRFLLEFDWVGTADPSAYLAVPAALELLASLDDRGWPGLMAANRAAVLTARREVAGILGVDLPAPDDLIGAMASLPLPPARDLPDRPGPTDPLQDRLLDEAGIQAMIPVWPAPPRRLLRLSHAAYNHPDEHRALARALADRL